MDSLRYHLLQWLTSSSNIFAVVIGVGIVLFVSKARYYNRGSNRNSKLLQAVAPSPPQAAGGWPIIGHLLTFGGSDVPAHVALGSMADKYGPIFSVQIGTNKSVVISSSDLVKECFTTNDKVVYDRPISKAMKLMFYDEYSLSSARYGSYWREARKISTLKLLSNQRVEMLSHIRNREVGLWFSDLYSLWIKSNKNRSRPDDQDRSHVLVEMDSWFNDMIFDVLVTMNFGKEKKKKEDSFVGRYKKIADESIRLMSSSFAVSDFIPWLGWLDNLRGLDKAMKQKGKELDSILGSGIDERRQQRHLRHQSPHDDDEEEEEEDGSKLNSSSILEEKKVFVDHMLSTIEPSGDQTHQFFGHDSGNVLKALCEDMIVGANEAASVSITWILCLLLNNRHILKKAQEELDANIGKERQVQDSDFGKLVYLQATIKEAMRLHPSVPLLERITVEDCEIGGFHVGAGTHVLVNVWKLQRDPNVWSDPLEFRPERFLIDDENANVDLKGQHFEFVPFGAGRRICPAITFSLRLLNLVLARLIHSFELRTPMDAMVDMTGTPALNKKTTPLRVLLTPRLNSKIYSKEI